MATTAYGQAQLLAAIIPGDTYVQPTWYVALFTTEPYTPAVDPAPEIFGDEVVGGLYARQPLTLVLVGLVQSNDAELSFPDMPGVDVVGLALMDDAVAGNMWIYHSFTAALGSPVTVPLGNRAVIAAGALQVSVGP